MDILARFETKNTQGKVCKLRKALYGLKQSPRAWFDRFTKVLKQDRYSQTQTTTPYSSNTSHMGAMSITVLILYVDDIVLTGNHNGEMRRLKILLSKEFEIKDLGNLKYFLGMEVARSSNGISFSRHKYVLDLLRETSMSGCKPVETPMDPNTKLEVEDMVYWKENKNRNFTFKSLFGVLDSRSAVPFPHSIIWNSCVPPKVGFFTLEAS